MVAPGRIRLALLALLCSALVLAGCSATSSDSGSSGASGTPADASARASATPKAAKARPQTSASPKATATPRLASNNFVPAVNVIDVRSGDTLNLQSVVPSDRPVLLWAWAPHCPSCRREAPALEQFAAANQDRIKVVGIGTQDDQPYAQEFLSTTGVTTPQMLWDPSFASWRTMGITAQPTWVLVRGDGSLITGWIGGFPEDQILAAVESL